MKNIKWIVSFLKELKESCFYGKIVLSYENGIVIHLKKERSIKAPK